MQPHSEKKKKKKTQPVQTFVQENEHTYEDIHTQMAHTEDSIWSGHCGISPRALLWPNSE